MQAEDTPTADSAPADDATPVAAPDSRPPTEPTNAGWPSNLISASTVLAWLAVLAFVVGVTLFFIPVKNQFRGRTLQDCGVPAAFLKDGRISALVDKDLLGRGATQADVVRVNGHQCSHQVADLAVPGAFLLLGGFFGGLFALTVAWIGHRGEHRARWLASLN